MRIADPLFVSNIRNQSFDILQRLHPRPYVKQPVVVVDIDEKSLEEVGQWPWPLPKAGPHGAQQICNANAFPPISGINRCGPGDLGNPVDQDILGFAAPPSISGSFDAVTGVLTFSGVASKTDYEAALQSVTFSTIVEGDQAPSDRQITFTVDDGDADSIAAVVTVNVSPVSNILGDDDPNAALNGDAYANNIYGLGGDDALFGNGWDDSLFGGEGADGLDGGDGSDRLTGGDGTDSLTGGDGSDEFIFLAATDGTLEVDEILDYQSEDLLNLDDFLSPTFPLDPGAEISLVVEGDDRIIQVGGVDVVRLTDIGGVDNYVDTINVFFEHNEVVAISNIPTV